MESADYLKRSRCFDGDVPRAICPEAEGYVIDALESAVDVGRRTSRNREAVYAIAVTGDSLQLVKVRSHDEIAARYLGGISSPSYDRSNNYRLGGS